MIETGWRSELDSEIPDGFATFTRANASEVLPEVVTPLVHSVLFELGERGFQRSAIEAGAWSGPVRTSPPYFQGCFYGRVVLNVSTLLHCAARLPGQDPVALGENYLGTTRARDVVVPRDLALRRLARVPRLVAMIARTGQRARVAARRTDEFLWDQLPLERLGADEMRASVARTRRLAEDVLVVHLHASSLAGAAYEALGRAVARWTGAPDPALTARLVTGLTTIESTKPTEELWAWSRRVLADAEQTALVRSTPGAVLHTKVVAGETATQEQARELSQFLERYGARGPNAGSSWREDPVPVLEMLRGYLDVPDDRSPDVVAVRQQETRARAVAELRATLNLVDRIRLRLLLAQTSRYLSLREQLKGAVVRLTSHLRAHAWVCADRLVATGALARRDDAAFLRLDEALEAAAMNGTGLELHERVTRRRAEHERNLAIALPETFTGRPDPQPKEHAAAHVRELRGIPVSPGQVTAPARVIRDLDADDMIEPGEILVAPFTDTGWTPLFAIASGLVVDLGGQLSHGSIVAREFGLPAVVNVKVGTTAISTGDTVTVDGDAGVVTIHRGEQP